jgi:hypothetical protein
MSDFCGFEGMLTEKEIINLYNSQVHDPSMIKEIPDRLKDPFVFLRSDEDKIFTIDDMRNKLHYSNMTSTTYQDYPRVDNYIGCYIGSSPQGRVEIELPGGYDYVDVTFANFYRWSGSRAWIQLNGQTVKTLYRDQKATVRINYSEGDILSFHENGIVWIGSIVLGVKS